jgi:phosphoribosylaminoimidazolecarboxamide formyltransferase/IMP cyclohydrolase
VAVNRDLPLDVATLIDKLFTEVIIAPGWEPDALEFLKKKKDRRLITQRAVLKTEPGLSVRSVAGGVLVQSSDLLEGHVRETKVVTKRAPNAEERRSMEYAWRVAKHVKSNAIIYATGDRTIGIGAGQMSRFDSAMIAVIKARNAGLDVRGTAVASDAFFPFADGLLEAVKAGATAVIQPGGSMRDEEVIKAADEHGIAMIFTGIRHFKH